MIDKHLTAAEAVDLDSRLSKSDAPILRNKLSTWRKTNSTEKVAAYDACMKLKKENALPPLPPPPLPPPPPPPVGGVTPPPPPASPSASPVRNPNPNPPPNPNKNRKLNTPPKGTGDNALSLGGPTNPISVSTPSKQQQTHISFTTSLGSPNRKSAGDVKQLLYDILQLDSSNKCYIDIIYVSWC